MDRGLVSDQLAGVDREVLTVQPGQSVAVQRGQPQVSRPGHGQGGHRRGAGYRAASVREDQLSTGERRKTVSGAGYVIYWLELLLSVPSVA